MRPHNFFGRRDSQEPMKKIWQDAIRKNTVSIISGGCSTWSKLDRIDQITELKRWANDEPREKGWLVLQNGVPDHFVKSDGTKEPLKVQESLTVLGYNILTSTQDGDPNKLSMFERGLEASGKYRYWKNRVGNVSKTLKKCHVVGLCEATTPMIKDLLRLTNLALASQALKIGEYDGSAILIDSERIRVERSVTKQLEAGKTQVLLASYLHDTVTDSRFWFVVLHLKSDGTGPHGGKEKQRVAQAERAKTIIDKLFPSAPTIIVGDLNSDRFLYKGFDEKGIRHVMDVFHSFDCVLPLKPTYHHYGRAAFDHILLRGAAAVSTHVPDSGGTAPNATQGSDHLPVRADVMIL